MLQLKKKITSAGTFLVQNAISALTALNHVPWLQCVLLSAICKPNFIILFSAKKFNPTHNIENTVIAIYIRYTCKYSKGLQYLHRCS